MGERGGYLKLNFSPFQTGPWTRAGAKACHTKLHLALGPPGAQRPQKKPWQKSVSPVWLNDYMFKVIRAISEIRFAFRMQKTDELPPTSHCHRLVCVWLNYS